MKSFFTNYNKDNSENKFHDYIKVIGCTELISLKNPVEGNNLLTANSNKEFSIIRWIIPSTLFVYTG